MDDSTGIKKWLGILGLINTRPKDSLAPWSSDDEYLRWFGWFTILIPLIFFSIAIIIFCIFN